MICFDTHKSESSIVGYLSGIVWPHHASIVVPQHSGLWTAQHLESEVYLLSLHCDDVSWSIDYLWLTACKVEGEDGERDWGTEGGWGREGEREGGRGERWTEGVREGGEMDRGREREESRVREGGWEGGNKQEGGLVRRVWYTCEHVQYIHIF